MAVRNLSQLYTRHQMAAMFRSRTETLDVQQSLLLEDDLDDILHAAINKVFDQVVMKDESLLRMYNTTEAFTEASGLVDISAKQVLKVLAVRDQSHGRIHIFEDPAAFQDERKRESTNTELLICRVSNILATDNKLQIQIVRGSAVAAGAQIDVDYLRTPRKVVHTDTGSALLVDLQDNLVPLAVDVAIVAYAKGTAPPDVLGRVNAQMPEAA